MFASVTASHEAVASSNMTTALFFRRARATPKSCLWPCEKFAPSSDTKPSNPPWGTRATHALARWAAVGLESNCGIQRTAFCTTSASETSSSACVSTSSVYVPSGSKLCRMSPANTVPRMSQRISRTKREGQLDSRCVLVASWGMIATRRRLTKQASQSTCHKRQRSCQVARQLAGHDQYDHTKSNVFLRARKFAYRAVRGILLVSIPSISHVPVTSAMRKMASVSDDLPAPVRPTIPMCSPGLIVALMPFKAGSKPGR